MQYEQQQAALAIRRVFAGQTLSAALAAVDDGAPTRGRALVQELAYGVLRHWGRLDALTRALASKPVSDPALAALIAVAIYQIDHTHAPAFAIVDRAVDAAALIARPQAKPLVNAMLRRYLREREALNVNVTAASRVAQWSYPRWWIGRVEADHPQYWQQILAAGNERPPLTVRVNLRLTTRAALLKRWSEADITAVRAGDFGIIVDPPHPVPSLPGYAEGLFSVQDLGAQLAGPLLDVHADMRVLDACAAPGGKTTHLLETAALDLTALDNDATRLGRLCENQKRLRLDRASLHALQGDAGDPAAWWDGCCFDRILVDVPCTASGVVRRHPDAKWLRRKTDIATFARQQQRILSALWGVLARGGKLLYSTCSVFAEENERRIAEFLAERPDALRETITLPPEVARDGGQLLPSLRGASHNQDGFFYALLRKG
ncbi:MAG: 16S rRNA (cytosine(967)-C(5))-methyltransferase RsmB [Casimicrobiaceae bacterium]